MKKVDLLRLTAPHTLQTGKGAFIFLARADLENMRGRPSEGEMGTRLVLCAVTFVLVSSADGARWIGPGSPSGPVERPQSYLETVAPLVREIYSFNHLSPASVVTGLDLGDFSLATSPPTTNVVADTAPVAGALPASEPIALLVEEADAEPTSLTLLMNEPVISVGFALLGSVSSMRLQIFGEADSLLGDYVIPDGMADERRWIGMSENDRDIFSVRIEPLSPGTYGIDDVEIGVHAPEPSALVYFLFAAALAFPARRVIVSAR